MAFDSRTGALDGPVVFEDSSSEADLPLLIAISQSIPSA